MAEDPEERMGILEIPVTRMIPSGRSWGPYTLTPTSPLQRIIVNEWLRKPRREDPLLITSLFHSWGNFTRVNFDGFLRKLNKMLTYFRAKDLEPVTLSEAYGVVLKTPG